MRPCSQCKGSKKAFCPICRGSGKASNGRDKCKSCNGAKWVVCPKCHGTGQDG
jgi:hypothetical protein